MKINSLFYKTILEERQRLEDKSFPDYQNNNGMGADFVIKCSNNSTVVMELARKTLLEINYQYDNDKWLTIENWKQILPEQFLANCVPEMADDEIAMHKKWWESLSYKEKLKEAKKEDKWMLSNWLYWLEPKERVWFWWGSEVLDENHFVFSAKTLDDLFLSGSLKWLFLGSGAKSVVGLDDFMEEVKKKKKGFFSWFRK